MTTVTGVSFQTGTTAGSPDWTPVSAANPLPVNASVTISPASLQNVNILQVGSAAIGLGAKLAASSFPVAIATDQTIAVSGTFAAAALQNVNITQMGSAAVALGQAAMVASMPVVIASNQSAVPVSGTVAATQSGTWTGVTITPSGTQTVGGQAASGATAAGNPVLLGGRAGTADPAAVADGQIVRELFDKIGRVVNAGFALPENYLDGFISSTATTAATIIASPGTASSIYITDLELSNTSTTQSVITLNNTAATQLVVPANGGREIHLQTPIKIAANTALTFTCVPAVTALLVGAQGYKGV